jgi:hypothetical protein
MSPKKEILLSAEVALHSASGKALGSQPAITAENIGDYLPAPDIVEQAQKAFAKAGFEVSQPAGLGFSISASQNVFEQVFKVKLELDDRGGVKVVGPGAHDIRELPAKNLPDELADYVAAATFSRPPDFGPGNY